MNYVGVDMSVGGWDSKTSDFFQSFLNPFFATKKDCLCPILTIKVDAILPILVFKNGLLKNHISGIIC